MILTQIHTHYKWVETIVFGCKSWCLPVVPFLATAAAEAQFASYLKGDTMQISVSPHFNVSQSGLLALIRGSDRRAAGARSAAACVILYLSPQRSCTEYVGHCARTSSSLPLSLSHSWHAVLISLARSPPLRLWLQLIGEVRWRGLSPLALLLNHAKQLQTSEGFAGSGGCCIAPCTSAYMWARVSCTRVHISSNQAMNVERIGRKWRSKGKGVKKKETPLVPGCRLWCIIPTVLTWKISGQVLSPEAELKLHDCPTMLCSIGWQKHCSNVR